MGGFRWTAMAVLGCAAAVSFTAQAQGAPGFPSKPVVIISPYTPGNTSDAEIRTYQDNLNDLPGYQVLLDYKPGGSGIIANGYVAKAAPDGYTLAYTAATPPILAALRNDIPYDYLKDLAPVVLTTRKVFTLVVTPNFPAKNFDEYIAYARANPGKVTWSTVGAGGAVHMTGEWIAAAAGIKLTFVHYKGAAASDIDIMAGRIDSTTKGLVSVLPLLKSGKMRVLAITTAQRTPLLPDVPTAIERGVNAEYPSWVGLLAPGATPKAVVDRLNADINKAIRSPKAMKAWTAQGSVVVGSTPEEFRQTMVREGAMWAKLVKDNNIKYDAVD